MLARLAENLFWAGRYLERAEHTTRLVDVTYHTLLESPTSQVAVAWGQLLDLVGIAGDADRREVDPERALEVLILDRDTPGSVTHAVGRARENARSVRELLSSELWEAVNDLHLSLHRRDLRRDLTDQPHELFHAIRRSCMTIYGTASETMPREEGWRFMALGRMLERATVTCRLVDVRSSQPPTAGPPVPQPSDDGGAEQAHGADRTDFHHWVAVLKSASAFEPYRRRYRASMDPADVVDFLLLAPQSPRSVVFCLSTAHRLLGDLCGARPSRALRQLGRTWASLAYRDLAELSEAGLAPLLRQTQKGIDEVADRVADEFFRHHPDGALHAIATS